jgi:hypothetical protein
VSNPISIDCLSGSETRLFGNVDSNRTPTSNRRVMAVIAHLRSPNVNRLEIDSKTCFGIQRTEASTALRDSPSAFECSIGSELTQRDVGAGGDAILYHAEGATNSGLSPLTMVRPDRREPHLGDEQQRGGRGRCRRRSAHRRQRPVRRKWNANRRTGMRQNTPLARLLQPLRACHDRPLTAPCSRTCTKYYVHRDFARSHRLEKRNPWFLVRPENWQLGPISRAEQVLRSVLRGLGSRFTP